MYVCVYIYLYPLGSTVLDSLPLVYTCSLFSSPDNSQFVIKVLSYVLGQLHGPLLEGPGAWLNAPVSPS